MKPEISNHQAIIELYEASTLAKLTKKQHDFLLECAKQLELFIKPTAVEEKKNDKK